jgi:hypothetical protein
MDGVLQIEMCRYRSKIVGVVIEVVTIEHLTGAAVAAAIVGNHAIAVLEEEQHRLSHSSPNSGQPWLNTMG